MKTIDINTFETAFSNWNKARGGDGRHTHGFIDWTWDYLESTLYTLEDADDRAGREQIVYEMVNMLEEVKGENEEWLSVAERKEAISAAWAYINAYDEQIVDEIRKELEGAGRDKPQGRPCDGDKPRKIVVALRVSDELAQAIDAARLPHESRGQAIRRLLLESLALTPQ